MYNREQLDLVLTQILNSPNVYFQPPASTTIEYPAILYSREDIGNTFANNGVYRQNYEYIITYVDKRPESDTIKKLSMLPSCRYSRHYVADNLNHDVFLITLMN